MGIRYMKKERENHLIAIHVYGQDCTDEIFNCQCKFDTSYEFSDGFKPDNGWYRIADYTLAQLKNFKSKNIPITYANTCNDIKELIER